MSKIQYFSLFMALLFLFSCRQGHKPPETKPGEAPQAKQVNVPAFNADSAYAFVAAQVAFGPRVTNSKAHGKCAAYLVDKLKACTPDVVVQDFQARAFNGTVLKGKNIIASFNKDKPGRILLCAHWDSRPFADQDPDAANHKKPIPGANDGASGVGVLLEVARQLSLHPVETGVDIVLFDAEDYGEPQDYPENVEDAWGLGSQYWSKNPHIPGYTAAFGILLDMVGVPNATFTQEGTSMYYAPDIVKMVWAKAAGAGFGSFFPQDATPPITDDHTYVNQYLRVPTIDIIHHDAGTSSGFYKYWHTLKDDMESVDRQSLQAVGQTLLAVIYR